MGLSPVWCKLLSYSVTFSVLWCTDNIRLLNTFIHSLITVY